MNYVPGTASLIDDIDKKHLVLLRDGRTLIGYLRSIDQFANLVFHQTVERIHVGKKFGDIPRGIFIVRGENVVLLGEIDVDKPCDTVLQQVSIEEILEEQRLQQQAKQETEKVKMQVLKDRGLSIPKADNLDEYYSLRMKKTKFSQMSYNYFWLNLKMQLLPLEKESWTWSYIYI
uniref:U6 snRNA-associated Sm-like protein LSm1 n=7 Tax=Percomorphaceae TaxID=1489872 RepID=A0A8D2ZUT6_SCOMX